MIAGSSGPKALVALFACLMLACNPSEVAAFVRASPVLKGTRQIRLNKHVRPMTAQADDGTTSTRQRLVQEMSAAVAGVALTGASAQLMMQEKAEAAVGKPAPSAGVALTSDDDRQAVLKTTLRWRDTVTAGGSDAPKNTAALYASDGVLWGTVSEEVRDTPQEIYDYFDYFARLPKLRLTEYTPVAVRVYGDFATQAGSYTFAWQGKDGETKEKRARFSFTFRRNADSPTGWTIVEHHSSAMPTSPAELKRASTAAF